MLPTHAAVSSSLTTLPAFETEHALFLAEQGLVRLLNSSHGASARAHSIALQGVADAYAARRAGDRGDNLARAAALLARAAALPGTQAGEKATRAAAFSRLARALLARAAIPQPQPQREPETEDGLDRKENKEIDGEKESKESKEYNELMPRVPQFMELVRVPDTRVERVAQKALLAATTAADAIAMNNEELRKLKDALEKRERVLDEALENEKNGLKQLDKTEMSAQLAPVRNLLAALHVDQARALFFGAVPPTGSGGKSESNEQAVGLRVKAAMRALKLAAKLRVTTNRRERAAGALADIMLGTLYAREKSGREPTETDRVRAARLLRSSAICLSALFGGASDSDSSVSDTPPTSPSSTNRTRDEFAQGSDCSEDSLGQAKNSPDGSAKSNKNNAENVNWEDVISQDAFEPFLGWDLDEVRRFVDAEIIRLGPVMQDSDNRRSCVLC